jgi:hypothetical protein
MLTGGERASTGWKAFPREAKRVRLATFSWPCPLTHVTDNETAGANVSMNERRDPMAGIVVTPLGREEEPIPEGSELDFVVPEFQDVATIRASLTRPAILPLGILHASSLEAPEIQRFLAPYIVLEVRRRHEANPDAWPLPVQLQQALVAMSPFDGGPSRVYLNDEVALLASVRTKYRPLQAGDAVTLDNIIDLRDVGFRDVDSASEPFAWIRINPQRVTIYFSFGPAVPYVLARQSGISLDDAKSQWAIWLQDLTRSIGGRIAQDMLQGLFEQALPEDVAVREAMLGDGWFPAPALIPDPWPAMCAAYSSGSRTAAAALAVGAISETTLSAMLAGWVSREPFSSDREFLEAGVRHYLAGEYMVAASILLPRIEGMVNRAREQGGLGATRKFTSVFSDLDRLGDPTFHSGWLGSRLHDGFAQFVERYFGATFDPKDPNAGERRGRHAHAHGATRFDRYDASYALQLLLAVDALFFLTTPAAAPVAATGASNT